MLQTGLVDNGNPPSTSPIVTLRWQYRYWSWPPINGVPFCIQVDNLEETVSIDEYSEMTDSDCLQVLPTAYK